MLIREWEIWHTFASYFIDPIDDLEQAAKNLVQSGLLECVFVDNGNYYWLNNSKLSTGHVEITLGVDKSEAWIDFDKHVPEGYARQVLQDSVFFHFIELQQFMGARNFPPRYIRGALGECVLFSQDYSYIVYPIVKLYSTGVILIEMRILAPEGAIGLQNFIDNYIKLYKMSFDNALIPIGLRIAAQHSFALSEKPGFPPIWGLLSYFLGKQINTSIKTYKTIDKSGDFEFEVVPLWDPDIIEAEKEDKLKHKGTNYHGYTILELAKDIFNAVSICVPGLRRGKSLLLKSNAPLAVGNFWSTRPHIHVLNFQGQASTSQQNDSKFQSEFGWIMEGFYERNSSLGKQFLPKNAFPFTDYGAYLALHATLWVWSKKGILNRASEKQPKYASLIFSNQSSCEILEYGYMLHRRMFELVGEIEKPDTALKAKEDLIRLETAMSEVSGYVGLRDLLFHGWDVMRVKELQTSISNLIAIRHAESSTREARRSVALQTILSVAFGAVAIPAFAEGLVKPLWNWLQIARPSNQDAAEVFFFVIALILIGTPILLVTRAILRKRS